jgi:hypothetical protein
MFVSRQRDAKDNLLFLEIVCGGPSKAGADILPFRYKDKGEGKNLVSPIDAVLCAERIYKAWQNDYPDENKQLRIVNDGPKPIVYDCGPKGFIAAKKWAADVYSSMEKCGGCKKPMGSKDPFEHEDIANMVFCTEVCAATKYRDMFNVEMPAIVSNKTKKAARKKP